MAERRQESSNSDGAVKIIRKKWYRLGIENVLLEALVWQNWQNRYNPRVLSS